MIAEPPPAVPWVVEGLAVEGALTLLTGKPGEGKSLLATALAAGVAQGETVAGLACRSPKDSSVRRVLSDLQKNGEIEKTPAGYVRSTKRHGVTVPVAIGSMTPDTRPDCASPEAHAAHHGPHPTTKRVICWRCHPSAGRPV
jgi:hypothetical protein